MLFKTFAMFLLVFPFALTATDGSSFPGLGPKQEGVVGAGVAKPQGSSWLGINPASIVDVPTSLDLSIEYQRPVRKVKTTGFLANESSEQDTGKSFVPNFSMVYKLNEDEAFGLGLFTVAGANTHFSNSRTGAGLAGNYDRNIDYYSLRLNAVYAKRFNNGWSIGFGPSIVYNRLRSDISLGNLAQTQGDNEWEESWGAGFSLGIYKTWEKWSFGAGYTSRQWTQRYHDYEDIVLTPLDHPQFLQVGIAYKITENLDFLLDYKWIDWNSVEQLAKPGSKGGFGWSDSHILKTGLVWAITKDTTFRCGYSYGKSPVNDADTYVNALFATPIEHHASIGVSHKISETMEINFSYVRGFKNGLRENNKDVAIAGGTSTSLELDSIAMGFSWKF